MLMIKMERDRVMAAAKYRYRVTGDDSILQKLSIIIRMLEEDRSPDRELVDVDFELFSLLDEYFE